MSKKGNRGKSRTKAAPAAQARKSERASARPPAAEAQAAPRPEPVAEVPASRARVETPTAFEAPAASQQVCAVADATSRDDGSIPPVDLDSPFFAAAAHAASEHDDHDHGVDPHVVRKLSAAAAARRAHLSRYVKIAVGVSAALCLAAGIKVALTGGSPVDARRASAAGGAARAEMVAPAQVAPVVEPPVAVIPPPALAAAAPPEPAPQVEPPAAPAETAPAPAPEPAAAAAPAAEPSAAAEPDPKAAAVEKHASQLALERGKVDDAIAAGERSVALDPTDAEAWLILGAAYQEKGDAASARRSFKACLDQGKRGPRGECAQMPH